MRIVIIGAVAGGTSAAAKARRENETADIVVYEKDKHISYAGCGMPYYLGRQVAEEEELAPRDADYFKKKYNIDILTEHEVIDLDTEKKEVMVINLKTKVTFSDRYDKLIIATGARSSIPPFKGREHANVFTLRTIKDMEDIESFIENKSPKTAAIIGTGFIGLEVAENLTRLGIKVTLIEKMPQVSPSLDSDMAILVQDELTKNGVRVLVNQNIQEITENGVVLEDDEFINGDLVLIATGVRPNVDLARSSGIEIGVTGAIAVNDRMETSVADIYAVGDCMEEYHALTGKPVYRPMGSTANKTGRIAGNNAAGGPVLTFKGVIGTAIYKVFNLAVAQTGLTEKELIKENIPYQVSFNIKPEKPEYLGGQEMVMKVIARKDNLQILGAEIIGVSGVDKRIDVLATAITFKATASDLAALDLAYAPPFSTAKDPIIYSGMILENSILFGRKQLSASEVDNLAENSSSDIVILDNRRPELFRAGHIPGAINVAQEDMRDYLQNLDKKATILTYCSKGVTANATQNILINHGFENVYSLNGGYSTFTNYRRINKK
ncbi:MAG: FAD-dependent oxidoreductase [Bacilli bacterium]|jgi:NADPH-dependent 2,4-dienoyl-CoA reductase/sulfur reductase-like enzyme/rhodanese-related sulfurtransferase|nr:FAD-dependent oxidoreductase [Bacilli bacterium]